MQYRLRLEVDGRNIRTFVNGELYNNAVNALPELEELYVCASVEEMPDGKKRTIVKVVNLTGEEKKAEVLLVGDDKSKVTVEQLADCALTAENTFSNPDNVTIKQFEKEIKGNRVTYGFPKHSVTILSFEA